MKVSDIEAILGECATPAYVFDLDALRERVGKIHAFLQQKNIDLVFAMKANPFLVRVIEPLAERFEVCSPGEFRICEREKLPVSRLVISGVNKEYKDIARIVSAYQGQGIYTIESLQQLQLLTKCAKESGFRLEALIRISSGNQFGVDFGQAKEVLTNQKHYPGLHFRGIQYYSGTQKKIGRIEKEIQRLDQWIEELQAQGVCIEELEYGPGFYVPYFRSEQDEDLEELLEQFTGFVQQMHFQGKITLEMGRFLVADCGSFLTSIVERKETEGQIYGIVDGGIHHLNYYGQMMAMKLPYIQHISCHENIQCEQQVEEKWDICGSLCTVADVIVKQLPLLGAQVGDVLVFERVGAYSVMEGINLFLSRDLPCVLFYSRKEGVWVVRKTQSTDLLNSRTVMEL